MKRRLALAALVLVPAVLLASEREDLLSARALFDRNVAAIRNRDRAAYLACYRRSDRLAVTGPEGPVLGYRDFADPSKPPAWPDTYDPEDLRLDRIQEGVVYGTYRYRVRYGADEHSGISERLFVRTPEGWEITLTTAFDAPAGVPPPPRALVGATLIDGTGRAPLRDAVVVVRGGEIDCAGSRRECPVPEGVDVTDVAGNWITPGLVDAHVHFSLTGWIDGRPDAIDVRDRFPYEKTVASLAASPERFFRTDLCAGVTAVFDVGGFPWTLELPARAARDPRAPHVLAAGPFLSTLDFSLNLPGERQFIFLKDVDAARRGVDYLAARGSHAVKVWFIVSKDLPVEKSAPAVEAAGAEAKRLGLPLFVHATGLAQAKEALKAGAKMLVHSVGDLPVDDEFLALARANGTIYCPTLTVGPDYLRFIEAAARGRVPAVDDPNGCVDPATLARIRETPTLREKVTGAQVDRLRDQMPRFEEVAPANLRRVAAAGIPIAMGTDAGNPLTLQGPAVYAEMEAMQKAGLTPMEVLTASTRGGSAALGMEKRIGTIEKGKAADLLVVAADPAKDIANMRKLRAVMRGGVLRSEEEMKAAIAAEK